jgi:hypothetical protein
VQSSGVRYSTRFFASPLLSNGQHTLVVTNLISSDFLFLDYFIVLRVDNDTTSQLVPVPSATLTSGKPPSQTSGATTIEGKSSSNTGTIVGSAIGAAALVILAVALMLWLRGRNRRTQDEAIVRNSCTYLSPPIRTSNLLESTFFLVRDNRSLEANPPLTQAPQSVGSTYPSISDSPSGHRQQNPLTVYDPYNPSSLVPPPDYIPDQSGARPRQYLPSKFT